jgi:DNA modification methylase
MQQVEFILMLKKGPSKTINNAGTGNLLSFKNPVGNKCHPTEKPVGLMEILIENSSEPEWIVLDPFMGSGTTGVAAVGLNRHFVGIELDKGYFDIAQTRIKAAEALYG